MTEAYLDTSFFLAIAFDEPEALTLVGILRRFERVYAGDLVVAEALAAATRLGIDAATVLAAMRSILLVFPTRSLNAEVGHALQFGALRGADVWHLAAALFIARRARGELAFLSRDRAQRAIAGRLGFATP